MVHSYHDRAALIQVDRSFEGMAALRTAAMVCED